MTSKYSPFEESYETEVESLPLNSNSTVWFNLAMDVSHTTRALFLKFTLIVKDPTDGLLQIDKISVDLGDGETFPPEILPSTTPYPVDEEVITLDHDSDYSIFWKENCTYMDNYSDFWVYGCPAEPNEEGNFSIATGFWSSCLQSRVKMSIAIKR